MGSCNLALARPSPKVKNVCIKCWNEFRSLQNVHKNNVRRFCPVRILLSLLYTHME